jgi:hypothetical protein
LPRLSQKVSSKGSISKSLSETLPVSTKTNTTHCTYAGLARTGLPEAPSDAHALVAYSTFLQKNLHKPVSGNPFRHHHQPSSSE